jgi:hypothetical protein
MRAWREDACDTMRARARVGGPRLAMPGACRWTSSSSVDAPGTCSRWPIANVMLSCEPPDGSQNAVETIAGGSSRCEPPA